MFKVVIHRHNFHSSTDHSSNSRQPSEPSRTDSDSADRWPTRLNQFSFSILNLQNIVKILTAVISCIFNPPYRLEIFMLQIPPISKIFQSPLLPQKTKFHFYGENRFFLDKDYIWVINNKATKCYINQYCTLIFHYKLSLHLLIWNYFDYCFFVMLIWFDIEL